MKLFCAIFLLLLSLSPAIAKVDESEAVEIGGIKQWIQIKGENDKAPVLLFLHGGPGGSTMRYGQKFTDELQKYFLVVQWDQRETGKTALLNATDKPLTPDLFVEDAVAMIRYLLQRYAQEKIYLVGHSWGSFLSLSVAARHPELLAACFAMGAMVNQLESERLSLALMKENAEKKNDQEELKELAQVSVPFQNGTQLYYHRKWVNIFMDASPPQKDYVEQWAIKWLTLFNEASKVNFIREIPEFKCPMFFLVGRHDYLTAFSLTEEYYKKVKASQKALVWFEQSGHSPNLTESKKFQETITIL